MKIKELFLRKKPAVAFEIFPPKPDMPLESIFDTLEAFKELHPDYISVTYGAGGSQKDRTIEIASKIKNEFNIESMAHFTCVGHSKDDIDQMLFSMNELGLENVLALRGDAPKDQPDFDFSRNAYKYANELIRHIKDNTSKCIAAAAYPEGHVECRKLREDMMFLKQKVDEGVDFLVTQLFFDNRIFYDFLDKMASFNIDCPVTPGIMPIFKADQIKTITARSGCSIPAKLVLMMDKYHDSPDDLRKAGIEYAVHQINDLIKNGAAGIHLYTMNRPKSTREILEGAGLIGC